MAVRKRQDPEATPPSVAPPKGIELLNRIIEKGEELIANRPLQSVDYRNWENLAKDMLIRAFGSQSQHVSRVMNAGSSATMMGQSDQYYEAERVNNLSAQLIAVKSVIEVLELEIELNSGAQTPTASGSINDERVFLVHGHDSAINEAAARFLQKLELDAVVLHEKPNEGKTIIEKFVAHSEVGFAVVLLTADDIGGPTGTPYERLSLRARQNVIFELGFFIGKIGRQRVCALYQEGVEIPSDYDGVLFIPIDSGGSWKLLLGKEMRAAGIKVDMNKVL